MISKITYSSYVIDFPDAGFNSAQISSILKTETDKLINQIDLSALQGWELELHAVYGSRPPIRIFKRHPSHKRDKHKLIVIHIPIPKKEIVAWGVEPHQQVRIGIVPDEHLYCSYLDVSFNQFSNRTDYVLDSMRRAISLCLEEGFTINSTKVKLKGYR